MTKQTPFQKFEALAQQLVEGSFNRFFGGGLALPDIATALARVLENDVHAGLNPTQYNIYLNDKTFDKLIQAEPDTAVALQNYLAAFVEQADFSLPQLPHLTLVADPAKGARDVVIEAQVAERPSDHTVTQIRIAEDGAAQFAADIAALDAYLIVDGQHHVPLTKSVISLGRSTDNDVVLDALTVSRKHAQIRWRYGRFILYDVSNRGRTKVNNQPVTETVLHTGDVIALSDVLLIYGEGDTQPRPRPRATTNLVDETQIRPPDTS
ncbi:FhaA domain-containing protein [Candidatus Leptofilum sp.]|uniref:FhaA domain-containing protein n=1 Tax=Candidatus Leptofilum sp. TaxID=3241576 RepID=UPI003B594EA4